VVRDPILHQKIPGKGNDKVAWSRTEDKNDKYGQI
jgi:hypothetical protein